MIYPAWQIKPSAAADEQALAAQGCGVLLRRVLAARGCDAAAAQKLLGAGEPLSDPFLMRDMDKAVARIEQAVENEELIVIYGDYDVDGISATAILYECLSSMGAHVRCKLPTRGSGYGLTRTALEALAQKGFKLVVTVDNGISAVEEAACAKALGLDLVITDHHLPGDTLPDAIAVVDPKRADDEGPFKDLCGAGVAFKLCAALEGCDPGELLEMYGELVALGTVADVMPLVGENRTLVREGLALLQDTMRPGLHALLENAGCLGRPVPADTVSYSLAPRLNAAGRMDNAAVALKLLLCGDEEQAVGIAARLAEINTERQQTEQAVFAEALKTLEPILIVVTDGRANAVHEGEKDPVAAAIGIAEKIAKAKITSVVIDTESDFIKLGLAKKVAAAMQANYYTLQKLSKENIIHIVRNLN